jgi:hypothetical protein
MGIRDRPTSPRSPWQNAYAERLIGSIRRECLDHVIVFSERHLRHLLLCYMKYYNGTRTHLSLEKMHRSRGPSIGPDTFFVAQSWADSITDMPGFNLRQAQHSAATSAFRGRSGTGEYTAARLVARFSQIEGYKCFSLTRALDVVKCQLALV